jgi:hypothetical protein
MCGVTDASSHVTAAYAWMPVSFGRHPHHAHHSAKSARQCLPFPLKNRLEKFSKLASEISVPIDVTPHFYGRYPRLYVRTFTYVDQRGFPRTSHSR